MRIQKVKNIINIYLEIAVYVYFLNVIRMAVKIINIEKATILHITVFLESILVMPELG